MIKYKKGTSSRCLSKTKTWLLTVSLTSGTTPFGTEETNFHFITNNFSPVAVIAPRAFILYSTIFLK